MIKHSSIDAVHLRIKIRDGHISMGGNRRLKIYGKLNCRSGKRMKKVNRVFFESEADAIQQGFRPCGHCLRYQFIKWKDGNI